MKDFNNSTLQLMQEKNNLIKDLNGILTKYGIDEKMTWEDIIITCLTVIDSQDKKLSNAVINHLWPRVNLEKFYHFTNKVAAESILNKKVFRLTNIAKRFNDREIETTCINHNLCGYLEKDFCGNPKYKSLIMPNTYYASFTDTSISDKQQKYLFGLFGKGNNGVRLTFNITVNEQNLYFKKMLYEEISNEPIPLLNELISKIRDKYGKKFVLREISNYCCFYLSNDYQNENEYRILHKVSKDSPIQPKEDQNSPHKYIELPLGSMSEIGVKLEITEVCSYNKLSIPSSYAFTQP